MTKATTPIAVASHLAQSLLAASGRDALMAAIDDAGIENPTIAKPGTLITVLGEARFAEAVARQSGDIDFCLRAGLRITDGSTIANYISRHSKDVGSALREAQGFSAISRPGLTAMLIDTAQGLSLRPKVDDPRLTRFPRYIELLLTGALGLARTFAQRQIFPSGLSFSHPRIPAASDVQRDLGCEIEFAADHTELTFPSYVLDWPIQSWDESLKAHLIAHGETLRAQHSQRAGSSTEKVTMLVAAAFPGEVPSAADVARDLGLSTRSMARSLREEGTSFSAIVGTIRRQLADQYLRDTQMPVGQIAFCLGYSGQAAFSVAFRRDSGQTPREFRRAAMPGAG